MGQVTKNGDLYTWTIPVVNNGGDNSTETVVTDPLPDGIKYLSAYTIPANIGTISYNSGTKTVTWNIGLLPKGAEYQLKINTKVIDITEAPFENTASITGSLIDPDEDNNTMTETVTVTTCPPSAGAVADPNSCLCGDVSNNDTPCTHGRTEYRLKEDSLNNLDDTFELDVETGTYNAAGKVLNHFQDATFQYSIWCIIGEGEDEEELELETSGPVLVTIPALFHPDQVFDITAYEKVFIIPPSAFDEPEVPTNQEVLTWASNTLNIPTVNRNGSVIVYNRPSVEPTEDQEDIDYEWAWWTINLNPGLQVILVEEPNIDYYEPTATYINLTPGATGATLNLASTFTSTCPGTTTWEVQHSTWITTVSIIGNTWTYNVDALIPDGEHDIIITPTCTI